MGNRGKWLWVFLLFGSVLGIWLVVRLILTWAGALSDRTDALFDAVTYSLFVVAFVVGAIRDRRSAEPNAVQFGGALIGAVVFAIIAGFSLAEGLGSA